MDHAGTQYIETDRLILRRFEVSDAQAMFDNWAIVLKENGAEPIGGISVVRWDEICRDPEKGGPERPGRLRCQLLSHRGKR